jgi:hypothetical protein
MIGASLLDAKEDVAAICATPSAVVASSTRRSFVMINLGPRNKGFFNKEFVGRTNRHSDQLICIGPDCGDMQRQSRFYFQHSHGLNAPCSLRIQTIEL